MKINVGDHFPNNVKTQQKSVQPPPRNTNPLHPEISPYLNIFERSYFLKTMVFGFHSFNIQVFYLLTIFHTDQKKLQKNSCLDGHTARLDGPAVGFPWCSEEKLQG